MSPLLGLKSFRSPRSLPLSGPRRGAAERSSNFFFKSGWSSRYCAARGRVSSSSSRRVLHCFNLLSNFSFRSLIFSVSFLFQRLSHQRLNFSIAILPASQTYFFRSRSGHLLFQTLIWSYFQLRTCDRSYDFLSDFSTLYCRSLFLAASFPVRSSSSFLSKTSSPCSSLRTIASDSS